MTTCKSCSHQARPGAQYCADCKLTHLRASRQRWNVRKAMSRTTPYRYDPADLSTEAIERVIAADLARKRLARWRAA